jgi:CheY-like chemotaxis protein
MAGRRIKHKLKNGKKKKIFIIDDERQIADMIAEFCQVLGFETYVYNDGVGDILSVIKSFNPDLISLDLIMEHYSGVEILEMLKSDELTKSIPVIIVSSIGGNIAIEQFMGSRVEDVLSKPIHIDKLKSITDQVFSH